jgi:radical SAM-linked protein
MAMYEIFKNGVRFDGWKDQFDINNYTDVFAKYGITHERYLTGKNNFWSMIDVGVSGDYFKKEAEKAQHFETTDSCKLACDPACDICTDKCHSNEADKTEDLSKYKQEFIAPTRITNAEKRYFFVIQYIKTGLRKFVGHIDLTTYFKCLFDRAGIDIIYTQGFNPHQRLQFSQALSLGVESECELIEFGTLTDYEPQALLEILQKYQHEDIKLLKIKKLQKSPSITTAIAYCDYRVELDNLAAEQVQTVIDKIYKEDLAYSLPKKDKVVTGLYKDIVYKIEIKADHLIATEIVAEGKPKFNLALEALFGTTLAKIVKIKMYTADWINVFDKLGE